MLAYCCCMSFTDILILFLFFKICPIVLWLSFFHSNDPHCALKIDQQVVFYVIFWKQKNKTEQVYSNADNFCSAEFLFLSCFHAHESIWRKPQPCSPWFLFLSVHIWPVDTWTDKRDIVFLLDGSDDSRSGFPAIREFVRRMAEELNISEDKVRVAVVLYSDTAKVYFNLRSHRSKKAIIYAIRSLRHKGGRPRNTGAALQFVQDRVFTASSGSRRLEGVPQILFVLTGGQSSDDVSTAALQLKHLGILSFAVGMKKAKLDELQKIAFSSRFLHNLPVFGELLSIQPQIAAFVQGEIRTEPPAVVGKEHGWSADENQTSCFVSWTSGFRNMRIVTKLYRLLRMAVDQFHGPSSSSTDETQLPGYVVSCGSHSFSPFPSESFSTISPALTWANDNIIIALVAKQWLLLPFSWKPNMHLVVF